MKIIQFTKNGNILYSATYYNDDINNVFYYGLGWIKVENPKIIELEDSKEFSFKLIAEISKQFNPYIAREYFEKNFINNATCWNEKVVQIANYYFLRNIDFDAFLKHYEIKLYTNRWFENPLYEYTALQFFDFKLLFFGMVMFDIVKFDNYLKLKFGYEESIHGSMEDFILSKFGKDVLYLTKQVLNLKLDNEDNN